MRKFSSYGPVNPKLHYYTPRENLIDKAYTNLIGENPAEGGHYITVWAPRQTGKSWLMQEILQKIQKNPPFDVVQVSLERLKYENNVPKVIQTIAEKIGERLGKSFPGIDTQDKFQDIFKIGTIDKPLILILDEFDALAEEAINVLVSAFRNTYIERQYERDKPSEKKSYLLHGVALIGVRSVLGIENMRGSPFNVQHSLHVPNLTYDEVMGMFQWYEKESGRKIEKKVIDRLFYETRGQPGLTCWFGELLSEGFEDYRVDTAKPVTMRDFEIVYAAATYALPNNNILNIISKARQEPGKTLIFEMFQTEKKLEFRFDDPAIKMLYMNGVVDKEVEEQVRYYLRFSCPFVQKRLFNYFSRELFNEMGQLVEPFTDLDRVVTPDRLDLRELMKLYQKYLDKNKSWLFKKAPRRSDLRVYEAVFHFNLYAYIEGFLRSKKGRVFPEFPTGNGKIDLLIEYGGATYGIELKSFTHRAAYRQALEQAARYGEQLGLREIFLVTFVETIDRENRRTYEVDHRDAGTGVTVKPIFICTGAV
ncbi:MAG: orc1/cdc6 family replication initiation protein [Candidatus Aminicenantes bacterium]|nr:orc1/cdc6 family replication initiation protein [Candidatus Aminicenantes bacterium]